MKKRYVILIGLCMLMITLHPISIASPPTPNLLPVTVKQETHRDVVSNWIMDFSPPWIKISEAYNLLFLNIPPTIAITSPSEGMTVNGVIIIRGIANDSDGSVNRVEVSIDRGLWFNATGTTRWTYEWDTTMEIDGTHKISARSYDGFNYSTIIAIDVLVNNSVSVQNTPPVINITVPFNGDKVNNITTIMGFAYDIDNDPLTINLRINQGNWEPVGTYIAPPYIGWNYFWNTSLFPNGNHIITAQAYDGQDYTQVSITVTVANPVSQNNVPPSVNITGPLDGTFVTGTVTLIGTASDIDGAIQKVEVRINNGPWNPAVGTTQWNYIWDTRVHTDTGHLISARSFDGSDYSEIYTINLLVDNTAPVTTHLLSGVEGENNWWTSNVSITLTGMDNASGIKETYYKLDTNDWENYTGPIIIHGEGVHVLLYYSLDAVGIMEANHSLTLKIDKTNPVTNHTITPDTPTGTNNWYTRSVTITLISNDSISWINTTWYRINNESWENYTGPFVLQDNGINTMEYYSVDNAGNQESIHSFDIKIDRTPPFIQLNKPREKRLYIFDRETIRLPFQTRIIGKITLEVTANDQTSGIQKVQYIIDYGTRIDDTTAPYHYVYDDSALLIHRHVITAKAVDRAGNTNNADEITIWIFNI